MSARQPLDAQQGEIRFRHMLYRQQVHGESLLPDEFDAAGITAILERRMAQTQAAMAKLSAQGIPLTPYLELGAERGQRSLVLENSFQAQGGAADISAHMLESCAHYAQSMNLSTLPLRLCCDAQNLPLRSNSLPFVFCYQTLHHFEDFSPVLQEVHRVLAPGGCFYFDEEPCQNRLHWSLYPGQKIYSASALQASKLKKALDYFLAEPICNESEYGVIEADQIPLSTWRKSLSIFARHQVVLTSPFRIKSRLERWSLRQLFNSWVGGSIGGTCFKRGRLPYTFEPLEASLICPACRSEGREVSLNPGSEAWHCGHCQVSYPLHAGVLYLFPPSQLDALYPERALQIRSGPTQA